MPRLINWELIRNPLNWVVVYLMVAFAIVALALIDPLGAKGNT